MNVLSWVLQVALAVLCLAGGACKAFLFDELANQMRALSRGGILGSWVFGLVPRSLLEREDGIVPWPSLVPPSPALSSVR